MKTILKIIIYTSSVIFSTILTAQHFQTIWTGNAFQPMSVIVNEATIDNLNCEAGDEIAVFDINDIGEEICVGTTTLTDSITPTSPLIITASKDDNLTSEFDGFIDGHDIIYKFWDNSSSSEITTIISTYDTTSPFVDDYTSFGTALVGLEGFSAINTTALSDSGCQGVFTIPITVNNMLNVTGFALKLDFSDEDISYSNYQNVHDSLSVGTLSVVPSSNSVSINWISSTSININNDTLLELVFIGEPVVSQSVNLLIWDTLTNNSYYLNNLADTLSSVFEDGQIIIDPEPENAGNITGNIALCQGSQNEPYEIDTIANATNYVWELIPIIAGAISGSGTLIHVDWSGSWSGIASLIVYGSNSCGDGSSSLLNVTIENTPVVDAGLDTAICFNESCQLNAFAENYSSILWSTVGDGVFDESSSLNAIYFPGIIDIANGEVALSITATAITPCTVDITDTIILSINQIPAQPQLPQGPVIIDLDATLISDYTTCFVENASSFQWHLYPVEAGVIGGIDTIGTVVWNSDYIGIDAYVYVVAISACGLLSSDTLVINVSPVAVNNPASQFCNIVSPNPSDGRFTISNKKANDYIELIITNGYGQLILKEKIQNHTNITIDICSQPPGVYYLRLICGNTFECKTIIIR